MFVVSVEVVESVLLAWPVVSGGWLSWWKQFCWLRWLKQNSRLCCLMQVSQFAVRC